MENAGHTLAVRMLYELREADADRTSIEAAHQENVARAYLEEVVADPTLAPGFAAVLTDFIASTYDGAIPDPEFYARRLLR